MFKYKNNIIIRILALLVIQAFCVTQVGFSLPAGTRQDSYASKLRPVNVEQTRDVAKAISADFGITNISSAAKAVGLTPEKYIELLDESGRLLTRHLRLDTVVTEKVALHLAMRELMASEKIVIVTAQPTAYSSLNGVFGHATVDKGTDAFAESAHEFLSKFLRENFSEEELKFYATYYNPYGGRWSFVFTQSAASKIDLEDFNAKLTKFLDNMLTYAVSSARQVVGLGAEDYPGAFNYIAGISNLTALPKTYKKTKLYRKKAKNVVVNALYAANRYRLDEAVSNFIRYIESKDNITQADISKAQEILDLFKLNSASLPLRLEGQIYDLKGQIDAEYCKSFLEAAANDPRDLLVYAENQYFPNELKINEFGPRYWRRLHGITNGAAFSKAMPQDATRVFLHTPKVDSWIKQKKKDSANKRLFEYFGFPKRIPNFTYLNRQKRNLKDRLEAGSIDRNKALAEQGEAGRQLETEIINLLKEEMRLTITAEDGVFQGERVSNTLINAFLDRTKGVVFVSGDFNLLSQAPIDVGTKIKVKGMEIIKSVFAELGMIVVRVGNGDEWVAVGPPNLRSKDITKAIKAINNRLANINNKFGEENGLLFDGKPVTYRAQLRSGEIVENFTPSVACGVVHISGNDQVKLRQRARLIPDKANFACEYAKDHRKGHRYYVTIPKAEKPLESRFAEADLEKSIPDELLPYCGKLYDAIESAIAIANASAAGEIKIFEGLELVPQESWITDEYDRIWPVYNVPSQTIKFLDDNIMPLSKEAESVEKADGSLITLPHLPVENYTAFLKYGVYKSENGKQSLSRYYQIANKTVGYIFVCPFRNPNSKTLLDVYIYDFVVGKAFQRQGIGTRLLNDLAKNTINIYGPDEYMYLHVDIENTSAITMYENLKFETVLDEQIKGEKLHRMRVKAGDLLASTELSLGKNRTKRLRILNENPQDFDQYGVAITQRGKMLALDMYQRAINQFIDSVDQLTEVEGMSVKIEILGLAGSFLNVDSPPLGIFPSSITFEEADKIIIYDRYSPENIEVLPVPPDIDIKVKYETPLYAQLSIAAETRIHNYVVTEICRKIFDETGVYVHPRKELQIKIIPIEEVKGDGLKQLLSSNILGDLSTAGAAGEAAASVIGRQLKENILAILDDGSLGNKQRRADVTRLLIAASMIFEARRMNKPGLEGHEILRDALTRSIEPKDSVLKKRLRETLSRIRHANSKSRFYTGFWESDLTTTGKAFVEAVEIAFPKNSKKKQAYKDLINELFPGQRVETYAANERMKEGLERLVVSAGLVKIEFLDAVIVSLAIATVEGRAVLGEFAKVIAQNGFADVVESFVNLLGSKDTLQDKKAVFKKMLEDFVARLKVKIKELRKEAKSPEANPDRVNIEMVTFKILIARAEKLSGEIDECSNEIELLDVTVSFFQEILRFFNYGFFEKHRILGNKVNIEIVKNGVTEEKLTNLEIINVTKDSVFVRHRKDGEEKRYVISFEDMGNYGAAAAAAGDNQANATGLRNLRNLAIAAAIVAVPLGISERPIQQLPPATPPAIVMKIDRTPDELISNIEIDPSIKTVLFQRLAGRTLYMTRKELLLALCSECSLTEAQADKALEAYHKLGEPITLGLSVALQETKISPDEIAKRPNRYLGIGQFTEITALDQFNRAKELGVLPQDEKFDPKNDPAQSLILIGTYFAGKTDRASFIKARAVYRGIRNADELSAQQIWARYPAVRETWRIHLLLGDMVGQNAAQAAGEPQAKAKGTGDFYVGQRVEYKNEKASQSNGPGLVADIIPDGRIRIEFRDFATTLPIETAKNQFQEFGLGDKTQPKQISLTVNEEQIIQAIMPLVRRFLNIADETAIKKIHDIVYEESIENSYYLDTGFDLDAMGARVFAEAIYRNARVLDQKMLDQMNDSKNHRKIFCIKLPVSYKEFVAIVNNATERSLSIYRAANGELALIVQIGTGYRNFDYGDGFHSEIAVALQRGLDVNYMQFQGHSHPNISRGGGRFSNVDKGESNIVRRDPIKDRIDFVVNHWNRKLSMEYYDGKDYEELDGDKAIAKLVSWGILRQTEVRAVGEVRAESILIITDNKNAREEADRLILEKGLISEQIKCIYVDPVERSLTVAKEIDQYKDKFDRVVWFVSPETKTFLQPLLGNIEPEEMETIDRLRDEINTFV